MNWNQIIKNMVLLCVLFAAAFCLLPQTVKAGCDCSQDTAIPPFLAAGADPNLLLMIDNSASMRDVAYANDTSFCYDDTFDSNKTRIDPESDTLVPMPYVGYFEADTWYRYNPDPVLERFQVVDDGACAGGTVYSSANVCVAQTEGVDGEGNPTYTLDEFRATGNFLNWATASKFDIEKKILTGGKYSEWEGVMESEGRGCTGNRYIKQVTVKNVGTEYKLVLGVHDDRDPDNGIDTTLIDIFPVTPGGFQPARCQDAIDLMTGDIAGFGLVKGAIEDCMGYQAGELTPGEHDKQALTDSLHDCWYRARHDGQWPPAGPQGFNFEKWCEDVYTRSDPRNIKSDDPAYVCAGDGTTGETEPTSFIGECFNPPGECIEEVCGRDLEEREECQGGVIVYCTNWNSGLGQCKNTYAEKPEDWVVQMDCDAGGATGAWKAVFPDHPEWTLSNCIQDARERFCGVLETPQVPDPSDLQSTTGETWNLPAMLMDQGAAAQVGLPITTARGVIETESAPAGLLHEFANQLRIGAMAFNDNGAGTECNWEESRQDAIRMTHPTNIGINVDCEDGTKDGARVIYRIGRESEAGWSVDGLVGAINNEPAWSWTPLAEAMFSAIGYYTQRPDMKLNDTDYWGAAPITKWCESNNVLFITDGASTMDLNTTVTGFAPFDIPYDFDDTDDDVSRIGDCPDLDGELDADCGAGDLYGSTYFDDLAYFGRHGNTNTELFTVDLGLEDDPQNINTFVVFTGKETGDEESDDETEPYVLMKKAVENGGPNAQSPGNEDEVLMGQTPEDLTRALRAAFVNIVKRAAAGSAASVISATRGGEGAVYQAIFWPGIDGPEYTSGQRKPDVTWAGEVHSLLVAPSGYLYEDTDGNKALTEADEHVVFFFDESGVKGETKACYGDVVDGVCSGVVKRLDEVTYLWSASEWLAGIDSGGLTPDIDHNRNTYISNERKRYIFTWNDLDNDGVVDKPGEVIPFETDTDWSTLSVAAADPPRGAVAYDFGVTPEHKTAGEVDGEVDALVSWIRGKDTDGYRSRELDTPANFTIPAGVESDEGTITWRLGDVVHSTPTSVSRPAENYHMQYRDGTYVDFVQKWKNRRHVIYFGANDGMIHAINGGFYNSEKGGFCLTADCAEGVVDAPALGAEMWAYVPYNLQPQLKCLTSLGYQHRYYVDLKPRIFDVQIFDPEDGVHAGGWGTIMVAGMRFGGSSVDADADLDFRKFVSSYVIFDITDPENPPDLMGELTYDAVWDTHMGYTTMVPAMVPMKEGEDTKWYLILGSGPLVLDDTDRWVHNIALEGISNQQPKLAVFPLAKLTSGGAFRIPDAVPTDDAGGRYVLSGSGEGFVSDPISVDFDLSPNYRADAVYFGTVEGDWGAWTGKFYRMVTNADDVMTGPGSWTAPTVMLDPERPITAAPNVGWDGNDFWVYFGTGRFFHRFDKTDLSSNAQESFYGIKEPVNCLTGFTWDTVLKEDLVRTDQIMVTAAANPEDSTLGCKGGGVACLPFGVTNFKELELYVAGDGCSPDDPPEPTGEAGWYVNFDLPRERNVGKATLLGGLATFTTYQPFDDVCRPEGEAYLYALYYKTGTPWHEAVFSDPWGAEGDPPQVVSKLDMGRGLATTPNLFDPTEGTDPGGDDDSGDGPGPGKGTKAFAQTSTGAIVEIEQPNLPVKEARTGRMYWRVD